MLIIKEVKLERIKEQKTRTDLVFSTKEELDPIELYQLIKTHGFLAFNADTFKAKVEDMMKNKRVGVDYDSKTKSQIQRGVLTEIALKKGLDIEKFYAEKMDEIIDHLRVKYLI